MSSQITAFIITVYDLALVSAVAYAIATTVLLYWLLAKKIGPKSRMIYTFVTFVIVLIISIAIASYFVKRPVINFEVVHVG